MIPHLFRTEAGRITAVLCKSFGLDYLEAAEDITSETFAAALDAWPRKGIPENPVAWLYAVAKNKAKNHLTRQRLFSEKIAPEITGQASTDTTDIDIDLSDNSITDSQLQMLFAICHPSIPAEAQIALSLRILCGFGIEEIANAFLSNKETISKRLVRAKEKLRAEKVILAFPSGEETGRRLETVLTTLYLLYSEGYYSATQNAVLREDLCLEAMRLTYLLIRHDSTDLPMVNALLALMCFHSSRFPARKDSHGEMVLYQEQDESLWDRELIAKGAYYLHRASKGKNASQYHLEAAIAYWHTIKTDSPEKWENILQLYNQLLQMEYSPIAALNRTFALSKTKGKEAAIAAAEKLQLTGNHYYHTLLGELYTDIDTLQAKTSFQTAYDMAKTPADKQAIRRKMDAL